MDLTTLYNLTTPELRSEAERLGVTDTYALSRAQLIHAIRSRAGSPEPEGLFGRVIGFAKWALQTTASPEPRTSQEPSEDQTRPETPAPAASEPEPSAREPQPERVARREPSPGSAASPRDEPAASTAATTSESAPAAKKATSPPTSATAPSGASKTAHAPASAPTSSTPPARAPAGVFSGPTATFEEPFPTRTMARILAEQGHYKRSLAIYTSLIRSKPDDSELEAEAAEVRSRSRQRRSTQAP